MPRRTDRHKRDKLADDLSKAVVTFTSSMRQVKLPRQQAAAMEKFTRTADQIIQDFRRRAGDTTRILKDEAAVRSLTSRAAEREEVAEAPDRSIIDFYLRELAKRADQRITSERETQHPRSADNPRLLARVRTAGTAN